MKNLAILLILAGSGLAAFGIAGFSGSFSPNERVLPGLQGSYSGDFGWSHENQLQIVIGVVALVLGVILRKESR
jgi:hypothetical protein